MYKELYKTRKDRWGGGGTGVGQEVNIVNIGTTRSLDINISVQNMILGTYLNILKLKNMLAVKVQ